MKRNLLFALVIVATTAVGLLLRLPDLDRRPMHQDEAIHAVKFRQLHETGAYRYDPHDYHGPTLNYLTLPVSWIAGRSFQPRSESAYRIVPVVFGGLLILGVWLVRDGLGRASAAWAAMLTAVSPAMVFYSRYYIQEMLLVFFTFTAIACGWRYWRGRRLAWAVACGASLGLMHATKETAALAVAAMLVSAGLTWLRAPPASLSARSRLGEHVMAILLALLVAATVSVTFYSSFFTNWDGPLDSLRTYSVYLGRAGEAGLHDKPWYYYLRTLLWTHHAGARAWSEGLILGLAAIGTVIGLARPRRHPFVCFLAVYTLLLTAAYSAIGYKTPWCSLSFLHGMILLAGFAIGHLLDAAFKRVRAGWPAGSLAALLLIAGVAHLAWQAWQASVAHAADQRNPYVYAQSLPAARELGYKVERLRAASSAPVMVMAAKGDYWPLPFYIADPTGYWGRVPQAAVDSPILIVSPDLEGELATRIRQLYLPAGDFEIRPGVVLRLYVEAGLYQRSEGGDE